MVKYGKKSQASVKGAIQKMKVAIVTGGGKGIGAEISRRLIAENWRVVVAEIKETLKKSTLDDPARLLFVKTDVSSEASVKNMVQKTLTHFGRIDALINNAGILPNQDKSIENVSLKIWKKYIDINLTGAFLCTKYTIPYLRKSKGSILNIASTRAMQSEGNDAPYSATKGGLVSLTHALAVSLGPAIRVNCISPGWVHTDNKPLRKVDHMQHPAGRVGKPEDIAALASFLISDEAGFITGQNFIADGGMTVKMIYAE